MAASLRTVPPVPSPAVTTGVTLGKESAPSTSAIVEASSGMHGKRQEGSQIPSNNVLGDRVSSAADGCSAPMVSDMLIPTDHFAQNMVTTTCQSNQRATCRNVDTEATLGVVSSKQPFAFNAIRQDEQTTAGPRLSARVGAGTELAEVASSASKSSTRSPRESHVNSIQQSPRASRAIPVMPTRMVSLPLTPTSDPSTETNPGSVEAPLSARVSPKALSNLTLDELLPLFVPPQSNPAPPDMVQYPSMSDVTKDLNLETLSPRSPSARVSTSRRKTPLAACCQKGTCSWLPCSICVGNVPPGVTLSVVQAVLATQGEVTECFFSCLSASVLARVMNLNSGARQFNRREKDPRSGKYLESIDTRHHWRVAYATYTNFQSAQLAVKTLNGKRLFSGAPYHKVVVCFATPTPTSLQAMPLHHSFPEDDLTTDSRSSGCSSRTSFDNIKQLSFYALEARLRFSPKYEHVPPGGERNEDIDPALLGPVTPPVHPLRTNVGGSFSLLRDGPPGANLFIYGVPSDWTESPMMELCQEFGYIVGIRVPAAVDGPQRLNRGFGFVSYDYVESARAALHRLPGMTFLGKSLKVQLKRGEDHLCPPEFSHLVQQAKPMRTSPQSGSRPHSMDATFSDSNLGNGSTFLSSLSQHFNSVPRSLVPSTNSVPVPPRPLENVPHGSSAVGSGRGGWRNFERPNSDSSFYDQYTGSTSWSGSDFPVKPEVPPITNIQSDASIADVFQSPRQVVPPLSIGMIPNTASPNVQVDTSRSVVSTQYSNQDKNEMQNNGEALQQLLQQCFDGMTGYHSMLPQW